MTSNDGCYNIFAVNNVPRLDKFYIDNDHSGLIITPYLESVLFFLNSNVFNLLFNFSVASFLPLTFNSLVFTTHNLTLFLTGTRLVLFYILMK